MALTWSAVTPALNEAGNLSRLAEAIFAQSIAPTQWVIVDTGSTDDTLVVARALSERYAFIRLCSTAGAGEAAEPEYSDPGSETEACRLTPGA